MHGLSQLLMLLKVFKRMVARVLFFKKSQIYIKIVISSKAVSFKVAGYNI